MRYALVVPRSGELEFDWHVPTLEVVGTSLETPLQLPIAARTRLVLDLPVGKRPEVAGGLVLESSADASDRASDKTRRWVIGIGDSPSPVLRIVDTSARPSQAPPTATFSEAVRCNVRSRGFDLETRLRINAGQSPLSQLSVALPEGLQLVEVTADDQKLAWR